jgi:hypothetical protein
MRWVGNAICFIGSEESFSRPQRPNGADVFQGECESEAAFNAETKVDLTNVEAQAEAVGIIANLCVRPLEN